MIITDQFVVLHFPKTGGTFVRAMLERIHAKQSADTGWRRLLDRTGLKKKPHFEVVTTPDIKLRGMSHNVDVHGTHRQVPAEHRHKPVVSVLRHPCDWLVSTYEYRNWTRQWFDDPDLNEQVRRAFPRFPEVTFEEYVYLTDLMRVMRLPNGREPKADVGNRTLQFFQFFARDPDAVLPALTDAYIDSGAYQKDIVNVTFLHMESLNRDLHEVLLQFGYARKDIAFIREEEKVFPLNSRRTETQRWQDYFSDELTARVRHKERLLFRVGGYE